MFKCQMIAKILVKVGIFLDYKNSSLAHRKIDDKSLSLIKVWVDDRNLENVSMEAYVMDLRACR